MSTGAWLGQPASSLRRLWPVGTLLQQQPGRRQLQAAVHWAAASTKRRINKTLRTEMHGDSAKRGGGGGRRTRNSTAQQPSRASIGRTLLGNTILHSYTTSASRPRTAPSAMITGKEAKQKVHQRSQFSTAGRSLAVVESSPQRCKDIGMNVVAILCAVGICPIPGARAYLMCRKGAGTG